MTIVTAIEKNTYQGKIDASFSRGKSCLLAQGDGRAEKKTSDAYIAQIAQSPPHTRLFPTQIQSAPPHAPLGHCEYRVQEEETATD